MGAKLIDMWDTETTKELARCRGELAAWRQAAQAHLQPTYAAQQRERREAEEKLRALGIDPNELPDASDGKTP